MSDISFHGVFAAFIFVALMVIGGIILIVSFFISVIQRATNSRSFFQQKAFGYVMASFIPIVVGLVFLYVVVSIKNNAVLEAFDSYLSFLVMVLSFAPVIVIGKRWKRKVKARTDQQYVD